MVFSTLCQITIGDTSSNSFGQSSTFLRSQEKLVQDTWKTSFDKQTSLRILSNIENKKPFQQHNNSQNKVFIQQTQVENSDNSKTNSWTPNYVIVIMITLVIILIILLLFRFKSIGHEGVLQNLGINPRPPENEPDLTNERLFDENRPIFLNEDDEERRNLGNYGTIEVRFASDR